MQCAITLSLSLFPTYMHYTSDLESLGKCKPRQRKTVRYIFIDPGLLEEHNANDSRILVYYVTLPAHAYRKSSIFAELLTGQSYLPSNHSHQKG